MSEDFAVVAKRLTPEDRKLIGEWALGEYMLLSNKTDKMDNLKARKKWSIFYTALGQEIAYKEIAIDCLGEAVVRRRLLEAEAVK